MLRAQLETEEKATGKRAVLRTVALELSMVQVVELVGLHVVLPARV